MNRLVAGAVLAVVAIALIVWWFGLRGDETETYEVRRGSIDVTIETIGRVRSTGATTIRSDVAGKVDVVAVEPGDSVVAGDIIIQLDTLPFERDIEAAERLLEEAEFALQSAQRLAAENPDDENHAFAVLVAAQDVETAEVALDDARTAFRDASIRVARNATMLEMLVPQGDVVNRNQPVATIYAREDLEVIANVDELDLVNVEIGAPASIRLDAFPTEEISGTVTGTAPQAAEQGGATIFATTIALTLPEELDIRPGMNADVTIITDARDDVLLVPQRAIRTVGERAFADVVVDGETQEREIVLGYRSGADVEVVSGLAEGDIVELQ